MTGTHPDPEIAELRRAIDAVRELVGPLIDLLAAGQGEARSVELPRRPLSPREVSELWGVKRRWVYNHAAELGGAPLGDGPRPRLGFDAAEVRERLGAPVSELGRSDRRRLTAIGNGPQPDSQSGGGRANFVGQTEHVAGRRTDGAGTAPQDRARR